MNGIPFGFCNNHDEKDTCNHNFHLCWHKPNSDLIPLGLWKSHNGAILYYIHQCLHILQYHYCIHNRCDNHNETFCFQLQDPSLCMFQMAHTCDKEYEIVSVKLIWKPSILWSISPFMRYEGYDKIVKILQKSSSVWIHLRLLAMYLLYTYKLGSANKDPSKGKVVWFI